MLDTQSANIESEVRSYCRSYPEVFKSAKGAYLRSTSGRDYLDFLSGCGSLNYGHNNSHLRAALIDYIAEDGVAMGLDLFTEAKEGFIAAFQEHILQPRNMSYKLQFTGPTGANAVEAAIKLARKVTGRTTVLAFTNAFHGCTLGALSLTANVHNRGGSVPLLNGVNRAFYDGYFGPDVDTADMLEQQLKDPSGGIDKPAAIVVELIQGEGGLNVASRNWVRKIARIAREHGALLIVDDIQAGCGRSGDFFSFETFGIKPDMVTMAKALSGYGLPMSMVLIDPQHDRWSIGEHNGTFRGNCHAFVTAKAAIETYWADDAFAQHIKISAAMLFERLSKYAAIHGFQTKGRGLMQGVDVFDPTFAASIKRNAFSRGLILELCGPCDEIVKFLPPLTATVEEIHRGVDGFVKAADAAIKIPALSDA